MGGAAGNWMGGGGGGWEGGGGSFMPAMLNMMGGAESGIGAFAPLPAQIGPFRWSIDNQVTDRGVTAPVPTWNGKPFGFVPADPGERNFVEKLFFGGSNVGESDDQIMKAIGSIVGSVVGGIYGGPIGGQLGGRGGGGIGSHVGSLF